MLYFQLYIWIYIFMLRKKIKKTLDTYI